MHQSDIPKLAWKNWTQSQKGFSDNVFARQNSNLVPIEYETSLHRKVQLHTYNYLKGNTVSYTHDVRIVFSPTRTYWWKTRTETIYPWQNCSWLLSVLLIKCEVTASKRALTIPSQSTILNKSVIYRYVHYALSTVSTKNTHNCHLIHNNIFKDIKILHVV
jgi:hypothetical protein